MADEINAALATLYSVLPICNVLTCSTPRLEHTRCSRTLNTLCTHRDYTFAPYFKTCSELNILDADVAQFIAHPVLADKGAYVPSTANLSANMVEAQPPSAFCKELCSKTREQELKDLQPEHRCIWRPSTCC